MKLTIAEIRDYYRKAEDKEAAIKELIISEGSSEKLIRCYVHDVGPSRPVDAVAPPEPVKKKIGRPVKNLKPAREPATPREEKAKKAPVKARPVDVVLLIPPAAEQKPKESDVQFTHFVPVTHTESEMFFADITEDAAAEPLKPLVIDQDLENIVADMNITRAGRKDKETKAAPQVTPGEEIEVHIHRNDWTEAMSRALTNEDIEARPKAMTHMLKCQQPYFDDIWEGYKSFEVRLNDREYESGDSVLLIAYNPEHSIYETRQIFANIGYLLHGDDLPGLLDKETVVFSLINIKRHELQEVKP